MGSFRFHNLLLTILYGQGMLFFCNYSMELALQLFDAADCHHCHTLASFVLKTPKDGCISPSRTQFKIYFANDGSFTLTQPAGTDSQPVIVSTPCKIPCLNTHGCAVACLFSFLLFSKSSMHIIGTFSTLHATVQYCSRKVYAGARSYSTVVLVGSTCVREVNDRNGRAATNCHSCYFYGLCSIISVVHLLLHCIYITYLNHGWGI